MPSLDQLLIQVRRIEQHREKQSEKQIRKAYQSVLDDLRHFLADEYSAYAEDDRLTYDILQRHGRYARFLDEVEQRISSISPEIKRLIRSTVDQTYEATYNGMIDCVRRVVPGIGLRGVTAEVIRRAVENPISKLTLNDRLEKHRREIIYDIKQNISIGLLNGDRYSTMAKRIKQSVDGDYKKAIRIVRTETHRVREAGNHDAATAVDQELKNGSSGMQMHKIWRSMRDERVRPTKTSGRKAKKYDHRKMDGVAIPVDEEFELPSGAKTMAPGQSGVAGEDINCRCYLSYVLKRVEGAQSEFVYKDEPVNYDPDNDYTVNLDGYTDEVNQGLSRAVEDVASRGSSDRCEHMHLVDLLTGELVHYETNGEPDSVGYKFWKMIDKHPDRTFAFVHNHNIISSLSASDLETVITTQNIPIMIAVQNDGVKYIAERTENAIKGYYPDFYFEKELEGLNKMARDGKISPNDRIFKREKIVIDGLIKQFFKKGIIKIDGRK